MFETIEGLSTRMSMEDFLEVWNLSAIPLRSFRLAFRDLDRLIPELKFGHNTVAYVSVLCGKNMVVKRFRPAFSEEQ